MSATTVHKITMPLHEAPFPVAHQMPQGAEIVHVEMQGAADIGIWFVCDPGAPKMLRHFAARGTGTHFEPDATYVGTVVVTPALVLHVVEFGA
jgi:hypothetical protein